MSKPLSERLAELLEENVTLPNYLQDYEIEAIHEAAALARRVEGAAVVKFWSGDHDGSFEVNTPEEADAIRTGQRVALVPVEGWKQ